MAKTRFHIRNATHMAEFPATPEGEKQAKEFRKTHPEFKRRRIRHVIQCLPSEIECGKVYELGGKSQ